jgi:hypothetical protein
MNNTAGTMTLLFTWGGLTSAPSVPIVVSPAAASELVIHTQPSSTATAGLPLTTQPVVYEEDPYGNLETGDNNSLVTVSLASGAGPLQGTTTATVTGGMATFINIADNLAETITLKLTSSGLTAATTNEIVVSPAAAAKLVIHTQPAATATAGQVLGTQPVIDEEDAFGNLETGDHSTVVTASPSAGAAQLVGATATVTGGVATFTELADDTAGTVSFRFTGGGLTAGPSTRLAVSPVAAKLAIQTQPSATATAGQPFATQPVIDLEDQYGNLETGDNNTIVTASLNHGTGQLQGTITATVSGGVATFTDLADTQAQTLSLQFSGSGLTPATSSTITVRPPVAAFEPGPAPGGAPLGGTGLDPGRCARRGIAGRHTAAGRQLRAFGLSVRSLNRAATAAAHAATTAGISRSRLPQAGTGPNRSHSARLRPGDPGRHTQQHCGPVWHQVW